MATIQLIPMLETILAAACFFAVGFYVRGLLGRKRWKELKEREKANNIVTFKLQRGEGGKFMPNPNKKRKAKK